MVVVDDIGGVVGGMGGGGLLSLEIRSFRRSHLTAVSEDYSQIN